MSSPLSVSRDRTVHPCGLTISIAQFAAPVTPAAIRGTSRNATHFRLPKPSFLLRSHQSSVDVEIPSLSQKARRVMPLLRYRSAISIRAAADARLF
jgi:hypothetical protein